MKEGASPSICVMKMERSDGVEPVSNRSPYREMRNETPATWNMLRARARGREKS
jgi:hypothetical protein